MRLILDRCVHIMVSVIKRNIAIELSSVFMRMAAQISATKEIMELIETTRDTLKDSTQNADAIRKIHGYDAKTTPAPVATPFPPLKFKNGVKICPNIAAAPMSKAASLC